MPSLNVKNGALGKRLAGHLLRRTTYVVTKQRIEQLAQLTPQQAVGQLFNFPSLHLSEPIDPETNEIFISTNSYDKEKEFKRKRLIRSWWLHEAKNDVSIRHRLMFFLHTNFTLTQKPGRSFYFFDYLQLLRFYTKGSFKELAKKIVTNLTMLLYLNNNQNSKWNPNENFAREFLELFTIGKGEQRGIGDYTNYTEEDIKQAARVLTGYGNIAIEDRFKYIDPETNIPRGKAIFNWHDNDDKTFSAAFGQRTIRGATNEADMWRELTDFVDMIFDKTETAQHICRKIYRYFVHRAITPAIEQDIIQPLAATFKDSNYNLQTTLQQLLTSQHFYDADNDNASDEIIGGLVKNPMELALGTMNFFDMKAPDPVDNADNHSIFYRSWLNDIFFIQSGMSVFSPPDVSGYPAYYQAPDYDRIWFNTNTIIARYKLPEMLIQSRKILVRGTIGGPKLDIVTWVDTHLSNPADAEALVNELLDYTLPELVSTDRKNYFLTVFLDDLSPINWKFEWQGYKQTGDPSNIRIPLEILLKTILYSQEYQMF